MHSTAANGERVWLEQADAVYCLAKVLQRRGVAFEKHPRQEQLDLPNGLSLRPQFATVRLQEDSVSTSTTIEVNHPELCPQGTFEYQHAWATTVNESLESGFNDWAGTDLPVFMDALRGTLEQCTALEHRQRQIILGPPFWARAAAPSPAVDHEFCPCCLLTRSLEAFREPLEGQAFCGVRLFALRHPQGAPQADCRINGVDWPLGAQALRQYVATWPGEGLEYRKQFVAICARR